MNTELQAIIDPSSVRDRSRYLRGKIYKLVNDINDDIYVGSCCGALCKSLYQHKAKAKNKPLPVHLYFNELGWDKVRIILIENVICENREQLMQREQQYIDDLRPRLNKISAYVNCPHGRELHDNPPEAPVQTSKHKVSAPNKDCNKCELCNKSYASKASLNRHYNTKKHKNKLTTAGATALRA